MTQQTHHTLGVTTWIFGDIPLADLAPRLVAWGCDGVVLPGDLSPDRAAAVRQVLDDHGLAVLGFTPPNVDLAHPDPAVRAPAIAAYQRMLDVAADLGAPLVGCHGRVGRVAPVGEMAQEWALLADALAELAGRAQPLGIGLALECLNRYESHLANTAEEGLRSLERIGAPNAGLLLDAYHMNIEEADPAAAVRAAGDGLWVFHVADSNRRAPGRGHIDFGPLFAALDDIGFRGALVVETPAPGPNPFTPVKGPGWLEAVQDEVATAARFVRQHR